jgi:hypothetical protein
LLLSEDPELAGAGAASFWSPPLPQAPANRRTNKAIDIFFTGNSLRLLSVKDINQFLKSSD